jgi:hypothetical protein
LAGQPGEQTILVFGRKVGLEHPARCRSDPNDILELERNIGDECVEDRGDNRTDGRDVLGFS